jgi:hypothetical protein
MDKRAPLGNQAALRILFCVASAWTPCALADQIKPKFGLNAVPIQQATDYLRRHPAPDYWALSPFYWPQSTGSDCSVVSIAMLLNAIRGVPRHAEVEIITPEGVLAAVDNRRWKSETAEQGMGVTFSELTEAVKLSLRKYGLKNYQVDVFKPLDASHSNLLKLQEILTRNELSDRHIALVYFNQGVLTGDWNGPHISPVGAYDAGRGRVLIMDVDRRFYVPYWSPVTKLLESMLKPAPRRFEGLSGETGGIVWVQPAP